MQKVVGSNPISRLPRLDRPVGMKPPGRFLVGKPPLGSDQSGALAEWLRSVHRFDSGRRLSELAANQHFASDSGTAKPKACPEYVPRFALLDAGTWVRGASGGDRGCAWEPLCCYSRAAVAARI
jgi:hypothetical protein